MTPPFEEKTYTSHDGLHLYYRDYPSANTGHPVLCLPGLTRNAKDFEGVAEHLTAWGHRVIAPDLRGRGRSDYDPNPENYAPAVYIQDILALLKQEGIAKTVVIGTSLGGVIAMVMAKLCPEVLVGVVLNDVGPEADPRGISLIGASLKNPREFQSWEAAATAVQTYGAGGYPDFTQADWLRAARATYRETPDGLIVVDYDPALVEPFMRANMADPPPTLWKFFDALARISTLALRGALSNLLSEATFMEMKRRKPDLDTAVIPNRGHIPLLNEPASLKALQPFLERDCSR